MEIKLTDDAIIGTFMGREVHTDSISLFDENFKTFNYSKDFNELFKVLDKVMDLCINSNQQFICHQFFIGVSSINIRIESKRKFKYFDAYYMDYDSRQEAIYNVVLDFIKWYKKTTK